MTASAPSPCPTRIERVVVHKNGALVTRRGALALRGPGTAEVLGLPLTFVVDTLRVRGHGCVVGLVDEVARAELVASPPPLDEAALLEHRLRVVGGEARRAQLRRLLDVVGTVRVELPPANLEGAPTVDALLQVGRFRDRQRRALLAELRAVDDELRSLARETERLSQPTANTTPPRVRRGVRVQVEDAIDDAAIEVEYFVAGARWVPSYTLELSPTPGAPPTARLVLGALVAQASGEDWDDVELAVSTADLCRATTLPIVSSWRLGRAQPTLWKGFRPLPSDLSTLFSGWDRFTVVTPATPLTPPAASAPRSGGVQLDERSEDELRSVEHQRTAAEAQALDEGAGVFAEQPESDADASADFMLAAPAFSGAVPVPPSRSMAAPALAGAPMPSMAKAAAPRSRAAAPAGGGGATRAPPVVVEELPPRLRTAALRMAGPDEPERGLLLSLTEQQHLAWLLDTVDLVDGDGAIARDGLHEQLQRALDGLGSASRRLHERNPPAGTSAPAGAPRVFVAAGRASVPGDGDDHRVEVHREQATASIVHVAVPRESLAVHRACRFSVAGPLPAGPVQVYEDGAFVVASQLPVTGGGTPVQLQLGVDPDVRIVSRTPHVHQSEKGLVGGTTHVDHRVTLEARSSRRNSVTLSVFDRVPVVAEGQRDLTIGAPWIKVNGASSTPASTGRGPRDEALPGGLRIDVLLQPDVPAIIEHGYALTLPAKLEVSGGNRRE
ncbi:MAG: DUF4139 domain-containing protein [Deltaproteobacteria bacterium]|nr:DUF4139 domain-containing protein [Deltaproteobacteria bacterium]